MTYYQACCTLVAAILAIAIHTDPAVNFIFSEPVNFIKRFTFALFYLAVTTPDFVFWVTERYPMTSIRFYSWLMQTYVEVYPEQGEEQEDVE